MNSSHFAKISHSPRLQKLFDTLKSGVAKTTFQLQLATGSMAIHSDVHELRQNGFEIISRYAGKRNGYKVYTYQMSRKKAA